MKCGALMLAMIVSVSNLDAKGGGFSSGGSRGGGFSSSSRSFGSSSSSRSSWGSSSSPKSSPSSAKYTGSGSSSTTKSWSTTPQTSTRVGSKTEVARYQSSVKSGKAFTSRESAVSDFKTKYASTYSSKFTSEPAKRPDHIPTTTRVGGNTYNVTYNQSAGGYGYWSGGGPGLGTWMMYDAMSDAVMMNTLMARNNYYVGPPVVVSTSPLTVFLWVLGALVLTVAIVFGFTWLMER